MIRFNFTSKTFPNIFMNAKYEFSEMLQIGFESGQNIALNRRTKCGYTHRIQKIVQFSPDTEVLSSFSKVNDKYARLSWSVRSGLVSVKSQKSEISVRGVPRTIVEMFCA